MNLIKYNTHVLCIICDCDCLKYIYDLKTLPFFTNLPFYELVAETTKMRTIRFNKENLKKSSCNCSWYMKNYLCGHIIALAERKKLDEFDPRADQILFDKKVKEDDQLKPQLLYFVYKIINERNLQTRMQHSLHIKFYFLFFLIFLFS